jgi:hypothetical protein
MKKPTIAILYICTGEYVLFWENFYVSAEKHLLLDYEKHYFVFTDVADIYMGHLPNIHLQYQQALPWPYPTLYRFKFFKTIQEQLKQFDFTYFFNANCIICKDINAVDFLPMEDEHLVVTQHPGFWDAAPNNFTYENNPLSMAYIQPGQGDIYAAGGLNGGKTSDYLTFIETCFQYTQTDIERGIIALWHDESYLNKYILCKKIKVLHPGFLYPDGKELPFEKMVHLENKKRLIKGYGKYSFVHKVMKKSTLVRKLFSLWKS